MTLNFAQIENKIRGIVKIILLNGRRSVTVLFLLFLFPVLDLQAQPPEFTILNGEKTVEIPFTRVNNLIVVPVLLENLVPLWFILDTGVRTTILTDRMISDMLNINYVRKYTLQGAGNLQQVEAYLTSGTSMNLQGLLVKGQPLLVLEDDYLELSYQLGMQVHGILGSEFFKRFVVKIDYELGFITLIEPESFRLPRGFEKFDLEIEDTKPYMFCELEEKASQSRKVVKLMIDTGASHALLLHQDEDTKDLKLPEETIFGHLGRGLAGDVVGQIGRIHEFHVGDFSFEEVLTSFPEDSAYNVQAGTRNGTLGGDILSRFTVIFDYPNGALYLKRNASYRDPFIYSRTGMEVIAFGQDLHSFKVVAVREDSPAGNAGIKVGDELLKINGRTARNLSLSQLINLFRKRNGKKIRLRIKRGEEEHKIAFRLQDII